MPRCVGGVGKMLIEPAALHPYTGISTCGATRSLRTRNAGTRPPRSNRRQQPEARLRPIQQRARQQRGKETRARAPEAAACGLVSGRVVWHVTTTVRKPGWAMQCANRRRTPPKPLPGGGPTSCHRRRARPCGHPRVWPWPTGVGPQSGSRADKATRPDQEAGNNCRAASSPARGMNKAPGRNHIPRNCIFAPSVCEQRAVRLMRDAISRPHHRP